MTNLSQIPELEKYIFSKIKLNVELEPGRYVWDFVRKENQIFTKQIYVLFSREGILNLETKPLIFFPTLLAQVNESKVQTFVPNMNFNFLLEEYKTKELGLSGKAFSYDQKCEFLIPALKYHYREHGQIVPQLLKYLS